MHIRSIIFAVVLSVFAQGAFAQGCPPDNGETIDELEAVNQLMIDGDYAALSTALSDHGISDPSVVVATLSETFPDGFEGCTTLLQRVDAGTVTQYVVAFPNNISTVYVYWRTGVVTGKFYILNLYLNTDEAKVFERML